jgi:hypothetical protein
MTTEGSGLPFRDDHVFVLRYEDGKTVDAKIRELVEKCSEDMRKHERCVGAIKEPLNIAMEDILVVKHEE